MSHQATAPSPLDGLDIHHDSAVTTRAESFPPGNAWHVVLDGEDIAGPISGDDADALALDIERAIATEKAIHDAPIHAEAAITTELSDPDGVITIYIDGKPYGEWGYRTAHEIETGLDDKLVDAQLAAWPRHDSTVEREHVENGTVVRIDGCALGRRADHVWTVDHAAALVERAAAAIARVSA